MFQVGCLRLNCCFCFFITQAPYRLSIPPSVCSLSLIAHTTSSPSPAPPGVYSHPNIYDIAFCSARDFETEAAFLLHAGCGKFEPVSGADSNARVSLLELACGPGRHAAAAAAQGANAFGLDLSKDMLSYARALHTAGSEGVDGAGTAHDVKSVWLLALSGVLEPVYLSDA